MAFVFLTTWDGAHAEPLRMKNAQKFGTGATLGNSNMREVNCPDAQFHSSASTPDGSLPKVLLLGDSVASAELGYYNATALRLGGVAEVIGLNLAKGSNGSTRFPMSSAGFTLCLPLAMQLAPKFDVISFNWGLHDIAPKLYGNISSESYVDNMIQIYETLKKNLKTNGKLLWISTTPVPSNTSDGRKNSDVVWINKLAEVLWSNYYPDVEQIDVYAPMVTACRQLYHKQCYPQTCGCPIHQWNHLEGHPDAHFNVWGSKRMADEVIAPRILKALGGVQQQV